MYHSTIGARVIKKIMGVHLQAVSETDRGGVPAVSRRPYAELAVAVAAARPRPPVPGERQRMEGSAGDLSKRQNCGQTKQNTLNLHS